MSQLSFKTQITKGMKATTRVRETDRLGTVRLLQVAIEQREVDERAELDDAAVLAAIDKVLKQRKDSIATFKQAGYGDLITKEAAEVVVLQVHMSAQLSEAEVGVVMCDAVAKAGAVGPQDMGEVMGILKSALASRADMTQAPARVRIALTGA